MNKIAISFIDLHGIKPHTYRAASQKVSQFEKKYLRYNKEYEKKEKCNVMKKDTMFQLKQFKGKGSPYTSTSDMLILKERHRARKIYFPS